MLARRLFCTLIATGAMALIGCGGGSGFVPTEFYTTVLKGEHEAPPKSAPGFGTASVSLVDGKTRVILDVVGLTGTITGAHIHTGAPNTNGPVVLNLMTGSGTGTRDTSTPAELHLDFTYNTTLTGLATGTHYINIHTGLNPGGELRGDLVKS